MHRPEDHVKQADGALDALCVALFDCGTGMPALPKKAYIQVTGHDTICSDNKLSMLSA